MGFILYLISRLLQAILVTIGVLYGLIKSFIHSHIGNGFKYADNKFLTLAKSIDKFGNVACSELFIDLLISKNSEFKFGKIEQTISYVLGKNQIAGTLTKTGWLVVNALRIATGKLSFDRKRLFWKFYIPVNIKFIIFEHCKNAVILEEKK
jgi:hypothetical protein